MPTSNDTRVRVEALWKIMPSVRPAHSGVRLARRLRRLEREAECEQPVQLGPREVPRAQEIAPGERGGGSGSGVA